MRNRSKLASLSAATTALTFLAVTAGGLVRATGSGLGCPGWPRCYGRLVPPADAHAIIEMTHRYLVSGSVLGAITVCASALLWHRRDRTAVVLGLVLVPLFFAQAALGAYVVHRELLAWTVVAHLALAMVVVATLIVLTVHLRDRAPAVPARLAAPAGVAAAATFGLMLLGSYVTGRGAGLAFRDWPLMGGRLVPAHLSASGPLLQFTHRLAALLAAALVGLVAARARGVGGPGRTLARLAAALFGVEILVGGLNVFTRLHSAVVTTHLGLSAAIWAVLVALWALARTGARETEAAAVPAPGLRVAEKVMAFVALTKPRIIELLLVTTVPTMIVAKRGLPSLWLVVATVGGGTLAAGGANAINNYVDRDIDKVMRRTRSRPLVTGAVSPRAALAFAVVLEAVAFAELWAFVNLLSALLAVSATLFYVFVYTLWLKRSSSQNIVIGGAAGAVPVLVGWSAVTGSLGLAPLVLFALIFWWTPPHFWALAIRYREDYAAAEVPMLPVVASMAATARRILAYTLLLWAASLAFWPVAGMGRLYLGAAIVLGGLFTYYAVQLLRKATAARAMRLFGYSISYISLLFGTMAVDRLIH